MDRFSVGIEASRADDKLSRDSDSVRILAHVLKM